VDRRERGEGDVLAGAGHAQVAPDLEALREVHRRPPAALAGRELLQASTA
jgi:hypothetical protein